MATALKTATPGMMTLDAECRYFGYLGIALNSGVYIQFFSPVQCLRTRLAMMRPLNSRNTLARDKPMCRKRDKLVTTEGLYYKTFYRNDCCNNLECLSLPFTSNLVYYLWARLGTYH